jgi:hypothetical protein
MAETKKWNIDDVEVRRMMVTVLETIFKTGNCITIQRLPVLLKRNYNRLTKEKRLTLNSKHRNINTYIKKKYGSFYVFMHLPLFTTNNKIVKLNDDMKDDFIYDGVLDYEFV